MESSRDKQERGAKSYEDRPAVRANGTVRPSAKPIMISRTISPWSEWTSLWKARLRLDWARLISGRDNSVLGSIGGEAMAGMGSHERSGKCEQRYSSNLSTWLLTIMRLAAGGGKQHTAAESC